jgi:hypothetical protein
VLLPQVRNRMGTRHQRARLTLSISSRAHGNVRAFKQLEPDCLDSVLSAEKPSVKRTGPR